MDLLAIGDWQLDNDNNDNNNASNSRESTPPGSNGVKSSPVLSLIDVDTPLPPPSVVVTNSITPWLQSVPRTNPLLMYVANNQNHERRAVAFELPGVERSTGTAEMTTATTATTSGPANIGLDNLVDGGNPISHELTGGAEAEATQPLPPDLQLCSSTRSRSRQTIDDQEKSHLLVPDEYDDDDDNVEVRPATGELLASIERMYDSRKRPGSPQHLRVARPKRVRKGGKGSKSTSNSAGSSNGMGKEKS